MEKAQFNIGEVISRVLSGDRDAFEEVVKEYERYVFSLVSRYVSSEYVEEIAHEVFVHAYKSLGTYKEKAAFKYWLSSIAVRRCYAHWQEKKKRLEVAMSNMSPEVLDAVAFSVSKEQFDCDSAQADAEALLGWALKQLSAENRMVLTLVHLEEYSVKEVADLLGWTVANVKVRAYRSRKALRRLLEAALNDDEVAK